MVTTDLNQLQYPITDYPLLPFQQKARFDWYSLDTSSASGSLVIFPLYSYVHEPTLTQPSLDFEEEVTQLSFKVASEPVGLVFFTDVVKSQTVPFIREFEVDLGE